MSSCTAVPMPVQRYRPSVTRVFHRLRTATSALAVSFRVGVVVAAAIVLAVVVNPLAGAVVAAVGLVIAITVEAIRPAGELRAAQQAPHPHGGLHHLLIVAAAPLAGDELVEEIVRLAGTEARLDVASAGPRSWSSSALAPSSTSGSPTSCSNRTRRRR